MILKTLKTLYSFHWQYKGWLILANVLTLSTAILTTIYPYFFQFFIDTATAGDFGTLGILAVAFIIYTLLNNLMTPITHYVGDKFLINSSRDARIQIFHKVQDLDMVYHTEKSTGSLISIFKRGDGAFWSLSGRINDIFDLIIQFMVMLGSFWIVGFKYAFIIAVLAFIYVIGMKRLIQLNIRTRKEFNEEEDTISAQITDNFLNFETVKLFAKELREQRNLSSSFKAWTRKMWNFAFSFRYIELFNTFIIVVGHAIIIYYLIQDLRFTTISLGQFVLVLGFTGRFFIQMRRMMFRFRNLMQNFTDLEKYFGLLDEPLSVLDPAEPRKIKQPQGRIEFNNVTFSYDDHQNVLRNINLTIQPGESVALVGRSGSGKTTFMKLLLRFYDPQKGTIKIDEINIRDLKKTGLRQMLGVVPQEPILFNNTIGHNIGYGDNKPTQAKIKHAAKLAYLDQFIESLPKQYKTIVGERGIKLSGGQKQRLAIARVLMVDPAIIIFDEATSHLDSEAEQLIQDAFWQLAEDKTTIIIAHRLSTIMRADRIIVMDKGKVVEQGTHAELIKNQKGIYHKLWGLQTEGFIES